MHDGFAERAEGGGDALGHGHEGGDDRVPLGAPLRADGRVGPGGRGSGGAGAPSTVGAPSADGVPGACAGAGAGACARAGAGAAVSTGGDVGPRTRTSAATSTPTGTGAALSAHGSASPSPACRSALDQTYTPWTESPEEFGATPDGTAAPPCAPEPSGLLTVVPWKDLLASKDLVEAGDITQAVDSTYPLTEAPAAVRHLEKGRTTADPPPDSGRGLSSHGGGPTTRGQHARRPGPGDRVPLTHYAYM
ncbi:zinc-binding dehydrogenase [Streptomyces longispororuber]|uniref:zinc-binding dehydrogenase n=1 Tax=Streptomyces longispororuber TaxID=68230 RepID=UPI0036FCDD64